MSFSRAAEELNVTPAAIGQQVRALESFLGEILFVRMNRSVELTAAGQALLPGIRDSFDQLQRTLETFYRRTTRRLLTISVEPSFGAMWLMPRLDRLRKQHPEIEIRLDATIRTVDFTRDAVDVAIRYCDGSCSGLRCTALFEDDEVFPVCSPDLLHGALPLERPEDLQWHRLLRNEWRAHQPTWPDWAMWLKTAGVENAVDPLQGPEFAYGSHHLMMEAVRAGQGIGLSSRILAGGDLDAGRLVRPFSLAVPQDMFYYLAVPKVMTDEPMVAAFREWICGEAGGSTVSACE